MPGQRRVCDDKFWKQFAVEFEESWRRFRRVSDHALLLAAAASDSGRPHD